MDIFLDAKKEKPFSAKELLQELAPLLDDYFIGVFSVTEEKIKMEFPNGQNFSLKIV